MEFDRKRRKRKTIRKSRSLKRKERSTFARVGPRISLTSFICYAQPKINFKRVPKCFSVMDDFRINCY